MGQPEDPVEEPEVYKDDFQVQDPKERARSPTASGTYSCQSA